MFGPAVFRPEPAASGGGDDDPVDYERAGFLDEVQGKAGSPVGGGVQRPDRGVEPGGGQRRGRLAASSSVYPKERAALTTCIGGRRDRLSNRSGSGTSAFMAWKCPGRRRLRLP
ncbi:hypothetical protein GCM10022251_82210 [Phytohabitans flavus]